MRTAAPSCHADFIWSRERLMPFKVDRGTVPLHLLPYERLLIINASILQATFTYHKYSIDGHVESKCKHIPHDFAAANYLPLR